MSACVNELSGFLVLGIGNTLRCDDGAGARVIELLEAIIGTGGADVLALAVHQLTPELAEPISRAGHVVFVDAAHGQAAGAIETESVEPAPDAGTRLGHCASPAQLLALADREFGGRADAELVSIGGESFALGETLSPQVEAACRVVAARICRRIVAARAHRAAPTRVGYADA